MSGGTQTSAGDLRGTVVRGVGWKLLGQTVAQGTSIAAGILLAHVLTPQEFGIAGMALVFTGLGSVFTDLALSAALVQRPTLDEQDRSTAFWTNVVAGFVLTIAGIASAPLVASFFSRPAVAPLFAASSTMFLLWAFSATQTALLTREMNFRGLEIRGMVSSLVGAAAAVTLALSGAGAWAIVGQALAGAGVSIVLLWRLSSWRPRLIYSTRSLRTLGSFGAKTLLSQFLAYLTTNMDNLLVGRYLGSRPLGVYAVAFNIMFLPVGRISRPIQQVAFAAFAKLQHDRVRLREGWLRGNELIAAVNLPAFLGMAVVAPDFVPVVLGHKWHAAVPVLQLLSLAGASQSFDGLNWSTVQAMGRPGVMLALRLVSAPLTLAAFAVGLRWGVVGVAGLFAGVRFVNLVMNTAVTCRVLGVPGIVAARRYSAVAVVSIAMGAIIYAARSGLVDAGIPAVARLLVLVIAGFGVYLALVFAFLPALGAEFRLLMRSWTRRRATLKASTG